MSHKEKGSVSITVEAAILMPLLIMLVVLMMMVGMFMYEKAAMRAVCDYIAIESAALCTKTPEEIQTYFDNNGVVEASNAANISIIDIYKSQMGNLARGLTAEKKAILEREAQKKAGEYSMFKNSGFQIKISLDNYVIHQRLNVELSTSYDLIMLHEDLNIKSTSVVQGQPEMIRTIDLAGALVKKTEFGKKLNNKYNESVDTVIDWIKTKVSTSDKKDK